MRRRDIVEHDKGIFAILCQVLAHPLGFEVDAESLHYFTQTRVLDKGLAGMAMVDARKEGVVETDQIRRRLYMPFAEKRRVVAFGPKGLGQGGIAQPVSSLGRVFGHAARFGVVAQKTHAGPTVLAGQQGRARGHAHRVIADGQIETHSFAGQTVDMGRADHFVAVRPELEGAELVAHAADDVGALVHAERLNVEDIEVALRER